MTDEKRGDIEGLKNQLEKCKNSCEEYLNGWKRERADFLNYKKDEMERIGEFTKYANEETILKILPILDSIYLAEAHVPEDLKKHPWIEGFELIKGQLCDFLAKEGIETIPTIGLKFDPNLMESVGESEGPGEPGTVTEETQKGYKMHGKLIRPAKVKLIK